MTEMVWTKMVCLRPVTVEDLAALELLDQSCFRAGIAYSREEIFSILASRRCLSALAESADGRVLGFWALEINRHQEKAHVLSVEVAPDQRRSGLGSLLMAHLEQSARALGLPRAELEVAEDNKGAQGFYLRLGYRAIGRVPRYYLERIDALRMGKLLRA